MSETVEAEGFDAEFDAARDAEEQDETGVEAGADGTEGTEEGQEQARDVQDPDKLAKQVVDTGRALKEARRTTRELKQQMEEVQAKLEAAERRQVQAPAQTQAPAAMPDPNVDPIGALEWMKGHFEQQDAAQKTQAQRHADQQASQRQTQALAQRMNDYEADFKEDHPDYTDAAEHLKTTRLDELKEAGFTGDDLNRALAQDMFSIVTRAMQAGKDPAEVVYNLAKRRGYGVDKNATKLQTIAKGQQAARSMPSGGRPSGHLPVDQGVKLKGAAFDKWFDAERQRAKASG
jgi:hypothetical protein